jgi:predicted ArsR family transcriptional regulator
VKNRSPTGAPRAGYGPLPTRPRPALSPARATVLAALRRQPGPITLADLSDATGLHVNTLREHIDALIEVGLVERRRAEPSGRGRPAWLYEAVDGPDEPESTYGGLAAALATVIQRTSTSPRDDAIRAGTTWGRELAKKRPAVDRRRRGAERQAAAVRRVVELFRQLGFAPETDDRRGVVRLTRCPLLDTAKRYPDVVCGVHLGIVRGAIEEYGGDPTGSDLQPFSEPGACRLDLPLPSRRVRADRDEP